MEPELIFNVRNQSISRVDTFHPVQNSRNYLYAQFNFLTSDWTRNITKTALFKGAGIDPIAVLVDGTGKCLVPWEVLEKSSFTVSVFAGDLITVDTATIKVYESGYESGRDVKDPTPSVYEQIMGTFDDAREYTAEQAQIAVNAAGDAKASRQAAESAANQAKAAAEDVKTRAAKALAEIRQKKTDAIGEIESARDTGVQAVNSAKENAQKEIAGQIAEIREVGADNLIVVNAAGDKWLRDINTAGKFQTDAIITAGGAQVSAVNTAGETQLSSIQNASTDAQTAIRRAKEDAVSAVQAEGETQVENIRQSAADYESLAIKETVRGESVLIEDSAKWPMKGLKLFGKSTQNGTPSPENPVPIVSVGDGGAIAVEVYSANLMPYGNMVGNLFESKGLNIVYDSGIVSVSGEIKGLGSTRSYISIPIDNMFDGTYFLKETNIGGTHVAITDYMYTQDGVNHFISKIINIDKNQKNKRIRVKIEGTQNAEVGTPVNLQCKVMLSKKQEQDFEPVILPQSFLYPTPNGLPGIPVSSGGNYTDENGQKWVCDEVDFGRGVYVKRVKNLVFDGSENWNLHSINSYGIANFHVPNFVSVNSEKIKCLSNMFVSQFGLIANTKTEGIYPNGEYLFVRIKQETASTVEEFEQLLQKENLNLVVAMIDEEEIPLTPDILSAYAALHMNYPTTTVLNDFGAGMEVEYVADTKNYIGKLLGAMVQETKMMAENEPKEGLFGEE